MAKMRVYIHNYMAEVGFYRTGRGPLAPSSHTLPHLNIILGTRASIGLLIRWGERLFIPRNCRALRIAGKPAQGVALVREYLNILLGG